MLRRNVLIFHQAALGDFIVTWPLAMGLARAFAQSRIIYVTHSQKGALAERVLRIESADVEGGWHTLFSDAPQLPERAAKLLAGAQLVISFTAGDSDALAAGVSRVNPEALVVSLDTKRPDPGHVTASLLAQLRPHPILAAAMEQMLRSIESRGIGFSLKPDPQRIVIHPGAGKEAKRWPAERFLELTRMLIANGKRVTILLGEAELERWPAKLIAQFESAAEVHRPATLLELLDQIASAGAFIGNDSGPAHLAGIIGVPTVCLFLGDPTRWHPLGPRVKLIHAEDARAIETPAVYTAAVAVAS